MYNIALINEAMECLFFIITTVLAVATPSLFVPFMAFVRRPFWTKLSRQYDSYS